MPRRFSLAHALSTGQPNLPIQIHGENPPALPAVRKGKSGRLLSRPQQGHPAATVADFRTAVLTGIKRGLNRQHIVKRRHGKASAGHLMGLQGTLQADAYAGHNQLYDQKRSPGPVASALCWSHARRKFFELADVESNIRKGKSPKEISPIAFEAVKRIDALFEIERDINGKSPDERHEARQRLSAPLVADLERWLRGERALLSKHAKVAKAIDYLLSPNHWSGFTSFLKDSRICLTNNAAERSLRGVALGRKSWLFAGSERGGQRVAAIYSLIGTAKLNGIDPQAWLADVIARISEIPVSRLHELLPWEWYAATHQVKAA
tara:strand:- start:5113 stop:6075 length:963 start_codon:yes stop_codon:yes gene_type:complete